MDDAPPRRSAPEELEIVDVVNHGSLAMSLSDAAGLIGRRVQLPNNLWDGCAADVRKSRAIAATERVSGTAIVWHRNTKYALFKSMGQQPYFGPAQDFCFFHRMKF